MRQTYPGRRTCGESSNVHGDPATEIDLIDWSILASSRSKSSTPDCIGSFATDAFGFIRKPPADSTASTSL